MVIAVAALDRFGVLDLVLDALLLCPSLLCICPPDGTLIFASHIKVDAGTAGRVSFVALLSAQATGEAAYMSMRYRFHFGLRGKTEHTRSGSLVRLSIGPFLR